ncbi:FecR domain-containing protein [Novosphingobium sp. RD2P27]|uniref:FecR domain-containing protein n=1 Tax=Novosphingobium kalidii TaxID=3230299 RepID=A0ABV2D481_9SPHN
MRGGTEADRGHDNLSRQASAWLIQLEDEPDNAALQLEFMDWLATSPAHLEAWEETERVSRLMTAAGPVARTGPVMSAILALPGRLRSLSPVTALASAALAACLAWAVVPDLALHLQSDEITRTGELRRVELDDGSTAFMAPGSAIAFEESAKGRTLDLLRGEAWFDVVRDASRPFRVTTGESTVTVLGTAFSVRKTDSGAEVAVQRGRVAVVPPRGAQPERIELTAGQTVSVDNAGETARGEIRPDHVASWREGVAFVNDQPIGHVIDRLRPWYQGYILARGPGLETRHVSGLYDLRDPDRALQALVRVQNVTVTHVSPWMRIVTVR